MSNHIPPRLWARDHYSTIAYAFVRAGQSLNARHMRTDSERYPTRLKGGATPPPGHDDYSCLEDAEAAGVVVNEGSSINPRYAFTPEGVKLAHWLKVQIDTPNNGFSSMALEWTDALHLSGARLSPVPEES